MNNRVNNYINAKELYNIADELYNVAINTKQSNKKIKDARNACIDTYKIYIKCKKLLDIHPIVWNNIPYFKNRQVERNEEPIK